MNRIKGVISYTLVVAACALAVIMILVVSGSTLLQSTRLLTGIILLCFLPGFAWSFALFPSNELPRIERLCYSIILSVGIVPTGLITANALHVRVTTLSTILVTGALTTIGFAFGMYRRKQSKLKSTNEVPTYFTTL